MASNSKVSLDSIQSLTFYSDEYTQARRTNSIPQLKCIGKPCKQYQPEVIRCLNDGGKGLDIQWKCEADLPERLRFGRIEVLCEGWSHSGDTSILKGSCALEYKLIHVPDALSDIGSSWIEPMLPRNIHEVVFMMIWGIVLLSCVYVGLVSFCLPRNALRGSQRPGSIDNQRGSTHGNAWSPFHDRARYRGSNPRYPNTKIVTGEDDLSPSWRPGFWTGVGLGGIAASLWNSGRNNRPRSNSFWAWGRPMNRWFGGAPNHEIRPVIIPGESFETDQTRMFRRVWPSESDRGDGASKLGKTRTATAYGGTTTR